MEQAMQLVNQICNNETNCRGLANNQESINALLTLKGINPSHVTVTEVPVNWNNQVVVLYQNNITKEYRELFVGIGNDGTFYFDDSLDEVVV